MSNILIIPMAGKGERLKSISSAPKPLILIDGLPMVLKSIFTIPRDVYDSIIFVGLKEHFNGSNLTQFRQLVNKHIPNKGIDIVLLDDVTRGQAETVYEGLRHRGDHDSTVMIFNCDSFFVDQGMSDFCKRVRKEGDDGFLSIFKDSQPRWSYVTIDDNFYVTKITEKIPISRYACTGLYYFKSIKLFNKYYEKINKLGCEHYVSLVYDEMLKDKLKIRAKPVIIFTSYGTPEDIERHKKGKWYGF